MTRINQVDQVLLLLREKLQRLDRTRAGRSAKVGGARQPTSRPLERLQAMAALDQLPEEEFGRTMIRALLSEELGDGIASDPAFQAVVEDVVRMIGASEEGRDLVERAAAQLRASS